NHSAQ
ncbi:hypothetical protein ECFDA507_2011, partial [Escherichia coli FDA507]